MIIVWGQRMYGRVDKFAGAHLATRFFHIYYLPLIPLSSWMVLEEQGNGQFLGFQVPMQWRSVLLAWLRIGAVCGLISGLFGLLVGTGTHGAMPYEAVLASLVQLILAVLVGGYAFFRLGKLGRDDKAARVVYWDFTGRFVDVALLADDRAGIKQSTEVELERHLARHATASYREAPTTSWRQIATRPDVKDVPLLKAALTRCRIEWAEASGAARQALARDHATILAKLIALSPELVEIERYEMKS